MNKIIAKHGRILTQTNAILEETKQFYESVYRNRKTEDCKTEQLIKRIPKKDCKTEQLIKRIPQNSRRKSREFGGENYS